MTAVDALAFSPDEIAAMSPAEWRRRYPALVRRLLGSYGEPHGGGRPRALTQDEAKWIRATYVPGEIKMWTLARRFGVSESTIWHVLHGLGPYREDRGS